MPVATVLTRLHLGEHKLAHRHQPGHRQQRRQPGQRDRRVTDEGCFVLREAFNKTKFLLHFYTINSKH